MKRPNEQRSRGRLHPEDVLAERTTVSAAALFDLIHEVNPTGERLPEHDRQRRYQLKARLQSLLLRRFSHEVRVRVDEERAGFLILDQAAGPRSACHAHLASLDEDVRSAVQRGLDLGDSDEAVHVTKPTAGRTRRRRTTDQGAPAEPQDDLARGQAALSEYDFEAARGHFYAALSSPAQALRGAQALLVLLVDHLAADREALRLLPLLPPEAAEHPEVRLLLGLAAARCNEEALALSLSRGLSHPAAAAIPLQLAMAALVDGRLEEAEQRLQDARQRDPVHPELVRLDWELSQARARACQPLEAEIERLFQAGQEQAAEQQARALLARSPGNEVARRALRVVGEQRRVREAQALAQQAEAAATSQDLAGAIALLSRALRPSLPADLSATLTARLAALEEQERVHQAAVRQEMPLTRLREGDLPGCLRTAFDLPPALRGAALTQCRTEAPQHPWALFEQIEHLHPGAPGRQLIEAAAALDGAEAALPGAPDRALALLSAHQRLLGGLPAARRLHDEAQRLLHERDQATAAALLKEARAGVKAWKPQQARAALASLKGLATTPEQETKARQLAGKVAREEKFLALKAKVEALPNSVQGLLHSLEFIDQIIELGGNVRDGWITYRAQQLEAVKQHIGVEVLSGPGPENELSDVILTDQGAAIWLLPGSGAGPDEVVLAQSFGKTLVLRFLELGPSGSALRVRRRVVARNLGGLRAPELVVEPPYLTLVDQGRSFIRFSLQEFHVLAASGSHHPSRPCCLALPPGTDHLWAKWHRAETYDRSDLFEVGAFGFRRAQRAVEETRFVQTVLCEGGPLVQCPPKAYNHSVLSLYEPRGRLRLRCKLPDELRPEAAVVAHPAGPGWLVPARGGLFGSAEVELYCLQVEAAGPVGKPHHIARGEAGQASAQDPDRGLIVRGAATAREAGVSFLRLSGDEWGRREELLALGPGPGEAGVQELYRVLVPAATTLVTDAESRRVLALAMIPGGLEAAELGLEPPRFRGHRELDRSLIAGLYETRGCGLHEFWQHRSSAEPKQRTIEMACNIQSLIKHPKKFVERLGDLGNEMYDVLRLAGVFQELTTMDTRQVAKSALQSYPDHPGFLLMAAEYELSRRDLDETDRLLRVLVGKTLPRRAAAHGVHLRAMLALAQGRFDETYGLLLQCLEYGGDACDVEGLLPLCEPQEVPAAPDEEGPPIRQLLRAIRAADAHLEAGAAVEALRVLDQRVVWQQGELQSFGRLCAAALQVPAGEPLERLRKLMILGRYTTLHGNPDSVQVPLRAGAWPSDLLNDVVERAQAWLTEDLRRPFYPPSEAEGG